MIVWGVYYYKTTTDWTGFLFSALGLVGALLLYRYLKYFLAKYSRVLALALAILGSSLFVPAFSRKLYACATCFQDPDSPLTQGTIWGVWFLLAVIVGVLLSIIFIARGWVKRSRVLKMEL